MRKFLASQHASAFRDDDNDGEDDGNDLPGVKELAPPATLSPLQGQAAPPQEMNRPTEGFLRRAGSFDGDLRDLPRRPVQKGDRPEREGPQRTLVPMPGTEGRTGNVVSVGPPPPSAPAPAPLVSFDGMDRAATGTTFSPPDTNGDVGPNHVIESVNVALAIYPKTGGAPTVLLDFDSFMSQGSFGNLCDTDNFGDPVVLYDTFEDRWIITDFAFQLVSGNVVNPPGMFQCFAVSKTADPVAGGWNFYSFNTTGGLGDYGKFGIWPDGLYMSFNMFDYAGNGMFQNVRVYAMNKAQMYANAPAAQLVSFDLPSDQFSFMPANARLQTGTPPAGAPNYMTTVYWTNTLSVWKFHVDWTRLALSTLTGPFESTTANILTQYTGGGVDTPGTDVDSLFPRLMMQNQYSNIGGIESLWNSHTGGATDGATRAAVRWFQVKVTAGVVEPNATQSATYNPADGMQRWMPSIGVNKNGDMAIGFSVSNATTQHPSLWYAARLAADPLNTLPLTDQVLVNGTGSPNSSTRWGDYATMTLDPDGCRFWFISEYYVATGSNWSTRIGSFNIPGCTNESTGSITGKVRNAASIPLPGATVKVGARSTTTNATGDYSFAGLPDGTYPTVTATMSGYNPVTATNVVVPGGGSVVQNLMMAAKPATSGCFLDTAQVDFQTDTTTDCDLNTSVNNIVLPNRPIDQQQTFTSSSGAGFTTTGWAAQTFTPSSTANLTRVDIRMFCSGCVGTFPNLTISIRATSGGLPTGGDLASATLTGFNSGAATWYTVNFAAPPALTAGTRYAIVARPTANPSAGVYAWSYANPGALANGELVIDNASGTNWGTFPALDFGFKTYSSGFYNASGTFTSSLKDGNPSPGGTTTWGTIVFTRSTPAGTSALFRVAASNSPDGPFTFVGPDGTAGTNFTSGASLAQFNGKRYLRYQVAMTTSAPFTATPTVNDVTICFASTPRPMLDLNADNTGDVFTYSMGTGAWKRAVANGSGGFTEANGSWDPNWTVTPAKFNADAYTDMFLFNTASGQWFRMLNDGANGWTTQAFGTWWPGWQRFIMDHNGDGISDVFLYDSATGVWFKATWTTAAGDFAYTQGGWNPQWEITPMILNGDAYGDMFLINRTTGRWFWVLGQAGPTFTYPATDVWYNGWDFYPGDFNADGLTDLLLHVNGGNYFVARNNGLGNGFTYTGGTWSSGWKPYVGDWDADGDSDLLLWAENGTGQLFQMMSDGVGGFTVGGTVTWSLGWKVHVTDLNSDGRSDIVLYHPTTGVWYQARNFTLGAFTYTSGTWATNLTIIVRAPFF